MKRPRIRRLVLATLLYAVCLSGTAAEAQLFGRRTLGGSLSRRQAPSAEEIGSVTTGRRFLREERNRGEFVGSDRGDVSGFIGATQGRTTGQVTSSIAGLREEARPNLNRPLRIATGDTVYLSKLESDLTISPVADTVKSSEIQRHLELSGESEKWVGIEVSVKGRSATLRGSVVSESDRRQAELLMLFEPGIDFVHNEIQVVAPVPKAPPPLLR